MLWNQTPDIQVIFKMYLHTGGSRNIELNKMKYKLHGYFRNIILKK